VTSTGEPNAPRADGRLAARLRFWIVMVGALVIISYAGSSAYDAWRSYHQAHAANKRELGNLAKALAEQTDNTLQTSDLLLRDTVAWYETEHPAPDSAAVQQLAARAAGLPQVRAVSIFDSRGQMRFRSRDMLPATLDVSDRPYFATLRDDPHVGVLLSEPLITRSEHRASVILGRRLEGRDGSFDGIAQVIVDLQALQRAYAAIDLGRGSSINVLQNDGTLVVRQPGVAPSGGVKFPELIDDSAAADGLVISPIDHLPRLVGLSRMEHFPLVVAVTRERSVALEGWRAEAYGVVARTLVLVLLCAFAVNMLLHQLRRIEKSERALRQSEERYALAMEGAKEGHFDWNFERGTGFLSPQMKLLHGRPEDAPVTSREAWLAALEMHPDDVKVMEDALRNHVEGHADHYEAEYRVRHADGKWHWLQARGRCVRDPASGAIVRFVGSAIDITSHRESAAEKERLEIQLRQSQKLEAIGTLAGGIAHDFNNILGAILGFGELAQRSAAIGSVVRRNVDHVMQAGFRAKALVERILAFSRSGVGDRGPVNVQSVIDEALELVATSLSPDIRMVKRLEGGSAAVLGDATQLHQVAMNLCTNAIQAMNHGGVLEVSLTRENLAEKMHLLHGDLAPGSYLCLRVGDTGGGIPPDVRDRMFDPFYTTKEVGEGTGLGLSLVHGIVADLSGAIDVQTALGQGTTFSIWLPISGEAAPSQPLVASDLPRGHGQTIMVVDDEKSLVVLAEEMLASLGYEPVGFESSLSAMATFRAAPARFDLILTDETMPDLVGTELAREIRALRPEIPIILMSGYSSGKLDERSRASGIRQVLRKPLSSRDIAECLDQVLRATEVQ
jgi:PAS domain S-box-containing protein